jgi:pentatricopeptide repeat protein
MQVKGLFPDEVTFRLIVGGLIKGNKLSEACRVWDQMMEKGFTLDGHLSKILINAFQSRDGT